MKTLKFIFCLVILSTSIWSCTNVELDDDLQTTTTDNVLATGGDDVNVDDGGKD